MADATIHYNEDRTEAVVVFPDGSESDVLEIDGIDMETFIDQDGGGQDYIAAFNDHGNLKADTLYAVDLTPVETDAVSDLEEFLGEEDEGEEGEGGETVEA